MSQIYEMLEIKGRKFVPLQYVHDLMEAESKAQQGEKTLHDEYTMAALTGILSNQAFNDEQFETAIYIARQCADEAMKQRKEQS